MTVYRDRLAAALCDLLTEWHALVVSATDSNETPEAWDHLADALLASGVVVDPAQALRDEADRWDRVAAHTPARVAYRAGQVAEVLRAVALALSGSAPAEHPAGGAHDGR